MILLLGLLAVTVNSPDGRLKVEVDEGASPVWRVHSGGKALIADSPLGLTLEGAAALGPGLKLISSTRAASATEWKPVYGERAVIPDRYQEALVVFHESIAPRRTLHLRIRAYDEGVAVRYEIPPQAGLRTFIVGADNTEFRFGEGTYVWETYRAQSAYKRVKAEELRPGCERPLLVETPAGGWAAVAEAGNRANSSMLLRAVRGVPGAVAVALAGPASAAAPWASPWRVVLVGDKPGDLLERNYLLLNLSPKPAPGDWSWVKPGKVIREVTLSTRGARECADFAAKRGLQYTRAGGWTA
jgi:alpha-glucosidase